jgi:hypothetical protein
MVGASLPLADPGPLVSVNTSSAGSSLREKIVIALAGFFLTGVVGTMATTWIQQRGWTWQNRVAKIDKDTQNALAAYQNASDLVNMRWHATYRMTRAIERAASDDEWKAAREEFAAADKDWAIRYTSVARDIAFYVDGPFAVDWKDKMKLVWPLTCTNYAFGAGGFPFDPASARIVLEIVNHCAGLVKDDIDKLIDSGSPAPPKVDAAERKSFADSAYRRLDVIYRTNETLRCVMFDRALAIHQLLNVDSYWGSFFGVTPLTYALSIEDNQCLE